MSARFAVESTLEVKANVRITARERGKLVARHVGSNIWLDLGREYLARLISFQSFNPDVVVENNRIKYIGLGIGGTAQTSLGVANSAPISPPYNAIVASTNVQNDNDPTVTGLERPVRVSGGTSGAMAGDVWIGQVQAPADFTSVPTQVTFARVFPEGEISYGPFLAVPLSECALFTSGANPESPSNAPVAYETFATISKTTAIALEVVWTIRF